MDNQSVSGGGGNGEYRGKRVIPSWLGATLGVLLVIFLAILIVQKGTDLRNQIQDKKPANTISVSGDGKVSASPDLATVNVGVLTQGSTSKDVKDQNNQKVAKIVDFIKQQGVDAKDINTSQFYFYPQQDYNNGKNNIVGYQGNQSITIKVRGIDKSQDALEKILDGVINVGANQIDGVSFSFNDPDGLKQEARKLAIEKAKEKAQQLADEAGLKLGKVVSLSESGATGVYPPMPYNQSMMANGMGGDAKSIAPSIEPGTQDIIETMTVVFELK